MDLVAQFELLTDAAQLAVVGGLFWVLAGLFALMERRRHKMRNLARLEHVGWVPWTTLFVLAALAGGGMLALGLPVALKG